MPSVPASGDVFTANVICSTGSSTLRRGNGFGSIGSAKVSPISTSGNPATTNRSPAERSATSTRARPSNPMRVANLRLTGACPSSTSSSNNTTVSPLRRVPWTTRPTASRPRYSDASRFVTSACSEAAGSPPGGGTYSMTVSSSGSRSAPSGGTPTPRIDLPSRATADTTGKSSSSIGASRSKKSCSISSSTSSGRASARSTLLSTTTAGSSAARLFASTYLVWGRGPSAASTSSNTPSTSASARSTSPPKSAWPGVSTRLMRVPFQVTAAALARMVMPRSRSWSTESSTRSPTCSWGANTPAARSMASTRVVLPWSTWATIAMLRMGSDPGTKGQG